MTRVLITADAVGGVWTYALDLARGLGPHGVETILAVTGPSPGDDQRRAAAAVPRLTMLDTGLPLDWLVETPNEVAEASAAIMRLADAHDVDLVHLNAPALAALSSTKLPLVVATHSCVASWWDAAGHGPFPEQLAWRTELHAVGLRVADHTIAPSASFADTTHRLYGVRPIVIHNGRDALPARAAPTHDVALSVGRLWDKGKNVAVLDHAAARLSVPLFAAGATSGPNGDSITLAHAHALGQVSATDLGDRLASRPVFVSSALYEPFGLAVLEAAAAGCALVLSDITTFRELWDGCATFVDPHDVAGFADAIQALIDDPGRRSASGEAARTRARRYTPAATAAETFTLYRTLLPTAKAAAA